MGNKIMNWTFCTLIILAIVTFTGIFYNSTYGQSVPPVNNTTYKRLLVSNYPEQILLN